MPTTRKKSKKRSKNYKTKRGDVAKHGSSINRINIRIMSPPQTSSTPAVHPESYAMAEQNRLHLSAVQQIVLDNQKRPTGTITPIKTKAVVSPFQSGTVRGDVINPFNRPLSAPILPEVRVARGAPSPEIQPASSGRTQTQTPPHRLRDVSVEPEEFLRRNMRIPGAGEVPSPIQQYYHPWIRRREGLLEGGSPLEREEGLGYMPVRMSPTKSKLTEYPTPKRYRAHMEQFYKPVNRPNDLLGATQGF